MSWDNDEKNEMIYRLIIKSYDFCMINCNQEITFDFTNFVFYLDANIIMRLMGINNICRKNVIERFVTKCKQANINLYVSSYSKAEMEKSIDKQIS